MSAVTLSCAADINKISDAAHAARRTVLQDIPANVSEEERKRLEAFLLKRTAHFVEVLSMCTRTGDGDPSNAALEPDGAVAELEGEVQALHQEVLAAAQRVAELRSAVPATLSEQVKGTLELCRPPAEEAAPAAGEAAQQEEAGAALSPAPAELQEKIASAAVKMPALRAKLEEALERLQRIMSANEAAARQAPPNTVERAARGLATPAAGKVAEEEGTPSPKLAEAVSSGKISTRRRIASSLRPLPYPKQ